MAIREIRVLGDDVLTKHCKEVTKMSIRTKDFDRGYVRYHV